MAIQKLDGSVLPPALQERLVVAYRLDGDLVGYVERLKPHGRMFYGITFPAAEQTISASLEDSFEKFYGNAMEAAHRMRTRIEPIFKFKTENTGQSVFLNQKDAMKHIIMWVPWEKVNAASLSFSMNGQEHYLEWINQPPCMTYATTDKAIPLFVPGTTYRHMINRPNISQMQQILQEIDEFEQAVRHLASV